MVPAILVLFGSHHGPIEPHAKINRHKLTQLIWRKHGVQVQPNQFIKNSQAAQVSFQQFVHQNPATEKHVYYVGHGRNQGQLVFEGGEVFLQNCLSVEGAPVAQHRQNLHLHLFMCYQHIAWDNMNRYLQLGNRDIYQHLNLVEVPHLTQNWRDQMNQMIQAHQLDIKRRGIRTETTMGDPEFGHFNLHNELQRILNA